MNLFNSFRKKTAEDKKLYKRIYSLTGIKPKNIALYHQALRHSSVAVEIREGIKNSNERLEYLGDAALGLIVAEHLFKLYPFKGEGFLTQMRSRIVNRAQLNKLSVKIGLDELIAFELKGNKSGSLYGDAFEALVGAICIDCGFEAARSFIVDRILRIHIDIHEIENTDTDFKSKLLNWAQQNKRKVEFQVVNESGPSHNKIFTVQVIIDGEPKQSFQHNSKRRAEQQAAELTISQLGIQFNL